MTKSLRQNFVDGTNLLGVAKAHSEHVAGLFRYLDQLEKRIMIRVIKIGNISYPFEVKRIINEMLEFPT